MYVPHTVDLRLIIYMKEQKVKFVKKIIQEGKLTVK